jgi:cobalt-zinc-cadmium efflux system protein
MGMEAMSGHVVVDELEAGPAIVEELNRMLGERFGVRHTTFQIEPPRHACVSAPAEGTLDSPPT